MPTMQAVSHRSNGGRLVSAQGAVLPLKGVSLTARAEGGVASVTLAQTFRNDTDETMNVTYTVPLPAGAAVAGYVMRVGERAIRGRIERREEARDQYERALIEGRAAGLLDQERSNVFTQQIGNVPPRAMVAVELTIHQRLDWLAAGMWEWRFPTVVAPRYLGVEGRVPDGGSVTVDVADGQMGARALLELTIADAIPEGGSPASPTHTLEGAGPVVRLDGTGARLDRDIVVRWPVARPHAGIALRRARPESSAPRGADAYGLLTIVPPVAAGEGVARDLILLLDTSGSMQGAPIARAKHVVRALIDSLGGADRLEMISFSDRPARWRPEPVAATAAARAAACVWVEALEAGGATEMTSALLEALRPLRQESQRQVILVTDGEIGFEHEIVKALSERLPAGSRLHAVGVGSAVNRALTRPAARAGRGVEVVIDLDEETSRGAERIVAATRAPVVVDLHVEGTAAAGLAPRRIADLMAGAPVLLGLRLRGEGGDLVVRGRAAGGAWEQRLVVPATAPGEGEPIVTALYGRETVEDLELDLAAGGERRRIERAIEDLGLEFGLATRLTSWVAIGHEPGVDPGQPVREVRMPQELPYGMSAEGLGLRPASGILREEAILRCATAPFVAEDLTMRVGRKLHFKADTAPIALHGRWIAWRDGRRVLQFEAAARPILWEPEEEAVLEMADGSEMRVRLDTAGTTAPGVIGAGMLIRAVFMPFAASQAAIAAVIIRCGPVILRITT